ncbi:MAG TPA: polyprenol monophosphomannose synthase [Pirellulales bacterium]|jgi:dolichol-phosphate mannosyltransferase|nr:polyprenol monophosphomannose synthase [Pirellulales bacterium]
MHRTLITLATYNEIENLPLLVDEILTVAPEVDILVIDDNSPDGTGKWCDEAATREPRLSVLHRSGKLGLGTATLTGMRHAIDRGYPWVLNMDADFSHHPRYLPALLACCEQTEGDQAVDVMIGSRYVPGGRIEGWGWKRHFMSRAVNTAARVLLGLKPLDCSGSYRCYRTRLLADLDFGTIRSRGYSFQEEILFHLARRGARIAETPITFVDRQRGQSKIHSGEALDASRVLVQLGLSRCCRSS